MATSDGRSLHSKSDVILEPIQPQLDLSCQFVRRRDASDMWSLLLTWLDWCNNCKGGVAGMYWHI